MYYRDNATIYISALNVLFLFNFLCGLEVAMKPYLVQTLRLAHKCVLVGYFCLTSKAIFHYQDSNNCMSRLSYQDSSNK